VHERSDEHAQPRNRARLLERLDKMVEAGRLTEDEAARLRGAAESSEFSDAVGEIRRRHATARLDDAVADGRLTPEETGALRERLENGEDPRFLRGLGRGAPPRDRRRQTTRDRGDGYG
jgi:hypothetical protein